MPKSIHAPEKVARQYHAITSSSLAPMLPSGGSDRLQIEQRRPLAVVCSLPARLRALALREKLRGDVSPAPHAAYPLRWRYINPWTHHLYLTPFCSPLFFVLTSRAAPSLSSRNADTTTMREIVHVQAGQCGNQVRFFLRSFFSRERWSSPFFCPFGLGPCISLSLSFSLFLSLSQRDKGKLRFRLRFEPGRVARSRDYECMCVRVCALLRWCGCGSRWFERQRVKLCVFPNIELLKTTPPRRQVWPASHDRSARSVIPMCIYSQSG